MIRTLIAATLPAVLIVGAAALFLWAMPVRAAECGGASWYGPGFHGKQTASGSTYNQNAMTAAHKSLPFGTKVKVTNLNNGRSVVIRVNDDGPHIPGRIIDLSQGAAAKIGMLSSGTAPVRLQILR